MGTSEFIASSWASRSDPIGLVMSQKSFHLHLQIHRNHSLHKAPFEIDSWTTTIDDVDLYAREWDISLIPTLGDNEQTDIRMSHCEPVHVGQLKRLFSPTWRLVHATKVDM